MAATEAHCAYCFETLAAKIQGFEPLPFAKVLDFWQQYTNDISDDDNADADADQAIADGDADGDADTTHGRPAAISRLVTQTPSSASSSSALSTPSRGSEASSASSAPSSVASPKQGGTGSGSGGGSYASTLMNKLLSPDKQQRLAAGAAEQKYPLFVTYNKVTPDGEKRLRGCIGTFEAHGLEEGLRDYAITR